MLQNRTKERVNRYLLTFLCYYAGVLFFSVFLTKMGCKGKLLVPDGNGSSWAEILTFFPIMLVFSAVITLAIVFILWYLEVI